MTRVTLDTNVYVSALHFNSPATRLLYEALNGELEIFISEPIVSETLLVLREKFSWQGYDVFDAGERLRRFGQVVTPRQTLNIIKYDPPG